MYHDNNWNEVSGDELAGFLDKVNPIDGKYRTSPASTKVAWRTLPFYESVALIRVKDPNWVNKKVTIYYLTDQGNLYRLNGTSPPIHEINGIASVKINEDNVLDYLRFFCFFVRGDDGPFYVSEDIDDPNLPADMDAMTRVAVEGSVRPASYEGMDENGYFLCDAVVFYSNALFIASFSIQQSGMVEMLKDQPVAGDLTSRIEQPIG
ncbi:MAG: hypothetical protein KAJ40_01150 [Alphaproteobacteria bacterium]|nr:hypothetical protein [Alphaproteobacteria bacterium]